MMNFALMQQKTRFSVILGFLAAITAIMTPPLLGHMLVLLLFSLVAAGYNYVRGTQNALEEGAKAGAFVIVLIELMVIVLVTLVTLTATDIFKPTINDFLRYGVMSIGFIVIGAIFGASGAFISRIQKTGGKPTPRASPKIEKKKVEKIRRKSNKKRRKK
jgi:hypothetical protein